MFTQEQFLRMLLDEIDNGNFMDKINCLKSILTKEITPQLTFMESWQLREGWPFPKLIDLTATYYMQSPNNKTLLYLCTALGEILGSNDRNSIYKKPDGAYQLAVEIYNKATNS